MVEVVQARDRSSGHQRGPTCSGGTGQEGVKNLGRGPGPAEGGSGWAVGPGKGGGYRSV
jgi:hypothetical protein